MKIKQHVPFDKAGYSFAFIEFEDEYESPEEAVLANIAIVNSIKEEGYAGLGQNDWAKARNGFYATGEINPELTEQMNNAQRYVINQMKLAQRSVSADDPVIN